MGEAGEPRSGYPINTAVEAFGDRWTLIVFRDIVFGDKRYLRECTPVHPRASPRMSSPTDSSD